MQERIQRTMAALEKNNMKAYYAESREQLHDLVRSLVKDDHLITAGGSVTLEESGVKQLLMTEFKGIYLDRSEGTTPEEVEDILHKAFVSDTFFASSNAITEEGELYNVDGRGNRVAAMIYGPTQVVLIVGVNKLVKNMEEAVHRVEQVAAPLNTKRLNSGTPCEITGKCAHCRSKGRICCSYVRMAQQRVRDRIKVIIVNENLGY